MNLTKKNLKDIGEIVGVTIVQYHELNVQPEFDKIHAEFDKIHDTLANLDIKIESGLSDVNRRLTDLNMDTPSRSEFDKHGQRIQRLEHELGFV
jgi:hypothetical protein